MKHRNMFKRYRPQIWMVLFILVLGLAQCTEDPYEPNINGTIKGQVKDAESGDPIENVTITTQPATEVVVTGPNGNYLISEVDTGKYSIVAEKPDYSSKILSVKVKQDDTAHVTILLSPSESAGSSDIQFEDSFMPAEGSQDQSISPLLTWKAEDGSSGDSITYDVFLYKPDSPEKTRIAKGITDTSHRVDPLIYNSVYYWQVKAMDEDGDATFSRTLSFKTKGISDNSFFFVKKLDGDYELMAYDLDHDEINPLTFNNYRDWAPKFNPQNGRIAFVSDPEVGSYIYTMNKNGGDIRQVTDIEVDSYHNSGNAFDWDPKQGKIVFSHYKRLFEINSDGTERNLIAIAPADREFREVEISPDGSQILAVTIGEKIYNSEIYLMDRDGSNRQELIGSLDGIVQSPSWSINGESILFTHDVSGNESIEGRMLNSQIFRLDLNTMDTTNLSQNKPQGTNDMHPRYSPTGAQIIFTNAPNDDSEAPDIYVMDDDGGNRENLVDGGSLPFWK